MRELIQELDTLMIRELYIGVSTWDELDEEDRATVVEAWQKSITIILSAVRDGRLDEELGVVGRWNITDIYEPTGKWLKAWLKEMMLEKDMHTLIALRGTGKEEEK